MQADDCCENFGADPVLPAKAEIVYIAALVAIEGTTKWLSSGSLSKHDQGPFCLSSDSLRRETILSATPRSSLQQALRRQNEASRQKSERYAGPRIRLAGPLPEPDQDRRRESHPNTGEDSDRAEPGSAIVKDQQECD